MRRLQVTAKINLTILADDDADIEDVLEEWAEESLGAGQSADIEAAEIDDYQVNRVRG